MSTTQFDGVSVITKANVYFDGKCVSHNIVLADGSKKSLGVILPTALPSSLKFNTGAPEVMELVEGACRVKLAGSEAWTAYAGGQSFSVGANTSFEIEVTQAVHYVCHFG
jgi:purine/pyrimidine-nucleoside phosphorylase